MNAMVMRSRIAVLVVAALLSAAGAFGTSAFPAADEAHAIPYNPSPCYWFIAAGKPCPYK